MGGKGGVKGRKRVGKINPCSSPGFGRSEPAGTDVWWSRRDAGSRHGTRQINRTTGSAEYCLSIISTLGNMAGEPLVPIHDVFRFSVLYPLLYSSDEVDSLDREYYAHSLPDKPVEQWQRLEEHLRNVARKGGARKVRAPASDEIKKTEVLHESV
jgi:hypothetical protein